MAVHLNLELTDRCNLKCRMCGQFYMDEVHLGPETFMAWETWTSLIDGLADFGDEVALCPHWLGEPTFHPQFDRFIRYAFEQNRDNRLFREFKLHTNAVKFDAARAENLLDCASMPHQKPDTFNFIHFSIDALTRPTYRHVKGADQRDRVYRNILGFLERRRARGVFFPRVTVAFIVMEENRREARGFLEFWRDVLSAEGTAPQLVYDWPSRVEDTIYIRRLHQEDQPAADELHQDVLAELAMVPRGFARQLGAESF
jgi:molybdenum cofactor biosynthesis enzyme MoaA